MTKKELIEALASFPDDMEVMIGGYESEDCFTPLPAQREVIDLTWEETGRYYNYLGHECEGTQECSKTVIHKYHSYAAETSNRRKVILL